MTHVLKLRFLPFARCKRRGGKTHLRPQDHKCIKTYLPNIHIDLHIHLHLQRMCFFIASGKRASTAAEANDACVRGYGGEKVG